MSNSIVGFWENIIPWSNEKLGEYEFFDDGSFTYHNCQSGVRAHGTYSVSEDILTLSPTTASPSEINIELEGDSLTLEYNGNVLGNYKRR